MIKSKNIFLYITIAVIGVFTVIYFVAANKVSYAFSYDAPAVLYDSKMNTITKISEVYAKSNDKLFEEKDTIYITVNDLVEKGLLTADDEKGNVFDPTSDVKTLNDLKIRISNQKGKIVTKILK